MNAKLVLTGLLAIAAFGVPLAANGQTGFYGSPYWGPCWGSVYPPAYYTNSVPYYAVFPPVYYSYRVARTYGYSPFAYPPGVMTPGSEPPRAAPVQNLYATGEIGEEAGSQPGHHPLRIDNPFVEESGGPGTAKSHKPAGRMPQQVYPAALAQRTN
jgi:hypothetical protein